MDCLPLLSNYNVEQDKAAPCLHCSLSLAIELLAIAISKGGISIGDLGVEITPTTDEIVPTNHKPLIDNVTQVVNKTVHLYDWMF